MGFTREQAIRALKKTNNNIDAACDWILEHVDDVIGTDLSDSSREYLPYLICEQKIDILGPISSRRKLFTAPKNFVESKTTRNLWVHKKLYNQKLYPLMAFGICKRHMLSVVVWKN